MTLLSVRCEGLFDERNDEAEQRRAGCEGRMDIFKVAPRLL